MDTNPQKLSAFPGLSGGQPAELLVPTLSLLSVLSKNSLPSELLYVWKFFFNSHSDCFNKSHVTRATFLDDTHHLLVHSQLRTERSSWALSPEALLGALSPLVWPFPIMSPAGSPGAPSPLGRLSAVSWGGLCGVRWKEQEVPMRLPTPAQQPAPTY